MARLQTIGFLTGDGYEGEREESSAAASGLFGVNTTVQSSIKYSGEYALRVAPTNTATGQFQCAGQDSSGRRFYFDKATIYVKTMFRVDALPAISEEIFASQNTSTSNKFVVRINSAGNLIAYQSNGTTVLDTGTTALATGTWYRLDFKIGTGASAAWEVKINGTSEISGTSSNIGSVNNGRLVFGKGANRNSAPTIDYIYDDIVVDDADYPVDSRIARLDADSAGTYLEWGAGAGSADYTSLDDIPHDSQTTYLQSSTQTQRLSVNCESLADAGITAASILSVKPIVICRENTAGTASWEVGLRSGTTDDYATSQDSPQGTTYIVRGKIYETDPATGLAWTEAGVAAAQPLVRYNEAAGVQLNCTAMCLMVEYVPQQTGGGAGKGGGAGNKGKGPGGGTGGKRQLDLGGASSYPFFGGF